MYKLITLLFALVILPGCAALSSALPLINAAVSDASIVLHGIETTVDAYQLSHALSPADRIEYDQLLAQA